MNDPAPSLPAPFRLSLAHVRRLDRSIRALYLLTPAVIVAGWVIPDWRISNAGLALGLLTLGLYLRRLLAAVVARFLENVAALTDPHTPAPDAGPDAEIPAPRAEPETKPTKEGRE